MNESISVYWRISCTADLSILQGIQVANWGHRAPYASVFFTTLDQCLLVSVTSLLIRVLILSNLT